MRLPVIHGEIDRRILVNYRVSADVLAAQLPERFRPQLVRGYGIAGICLIRLKQIRPSFLPRFVGIASENAAHRFAVEWDTPGGVRTGVYIPRRDTSLWLNVLVGGRLFPGVHHHARFDVNESNNRYCVEMQSRDSSAHVAVDGQSTSSLPADSVFESVQEVSDFFESGSLGYSPASTDGTYDGLELRTHNWHVEALDVSVVKSSMFDDHNAFPNGSVTFDNALLMKGIRHEWHERETMCCAETPASGSVAVSA